MTLYRCGYCGGCTDKDGNPIDWYEDIGWDTAEQTQGLCCAVRDRPTITVTREMAMDAECPEMEGRSIQW